MPVKRKSAKPTPKVHAAESIYIDPLGCDSTVSYKVVTGRTSGRVWGSVQLADCNRKIDWFFPDKKESLAKIERAIEALQNFRTAFELAQKSKPKVTRKKRTVKGDNAQG